MILNSEGQLKISITFGIGPYTKGKNNQKKSNCDIPSTTMPKPNKYHLKVKNYQTH